MTPERNALLQQLNKLLPAQFNAVRERFGLPAEYLRAQVSQAEQGTDLLRYAEQRDDGLARLQSVIAEVLPSGGEMRLEKSRLIQLKGALFDRMDELGDAFQTLGAYLKHIEKTGVAEEQLFILDSVEDFLLQRANSLPLEKFIEFCRSQLFQTSTRLDYVGLARRLQYGDAALFLGLGASTMLAADALSKLAACSDYHDFQSLPEACEYLQIHSGRGFLVEQARHLLHSGETPALYEMLARIEKPLLIVYAGYDRLLEETFQRHAKAYACVSHGGERERRWLDIEYSNRAAQSCDGEDFSKLQLLENGYSLIYRIRGLFRDGSDERLMLSEQDYLNFVRHGKIPDYIATRLDRKSLWFLGHYPRSWEDRMLINAMLEKRSRDADITLAIHKDADPFAQVHWKKRNHVDSYSLELPEFVAELERHLAQE